MDFSEKTPFPKDPFFRTRSNQAEQIRVGLELADFPVSNFPIIFCNLLSVGERWWEAQLQTPNTLVNAESTYGWGRKHYLINSKQISVR